MKLIKRPSELDQQTSRATRPPLPRDATKNGCNYHESGMVPPGYVSVWDFGNGHQTKRSPVTVSGKKVVQK